MYMHVCDANDVEHTQYYVSLVCIKVYFKK